jgi:hypothetical protein
MTSAINGAGTTYPSGAPEFTPVFFSRIRVARSLVFCVVFCRSLFILFWGQCVVRPSSYSFWLPLWYLQTLLLPLISSNSSSPSGIFKLFFSLWYLQTLLLPLISSNSSSPSDIFKLFFSLWYLQTLLLPLISSNSSSPSDIFKLFFSLWYLQTCLTLYCRTSAPDIIILPL